MADDLSGLISELHFSILSVSGPTLPGIRDPPSPIPYPLSPKAYTQNTHEILMHKKKKETSPCIDTNHGIYTLLLLHNSTQIHKSCG